MSIPLVPMKTGQTELFTYLLNLWNQSILQQTHKSAMTLKWERVLQQQSLVDDYK